MNLGRYRFSPPWWGVLLFCVGAAIFCALGVWQVERAHYKEGLVAARQAARQAGRAPMQPQGAPAEGNARVADLVHGREYAATGRYEPGRQILLADQLRGARTGYRVWTPLRLDNGIRVMVDRGWIEKPAAGEPLPDPPAPTTPVQVTGFWRSFVQPALQWGGTVDCTDRDWPRVLSYPDAAAVRCQYGAPVVDGLLLLDPQAPDGFVREWEDDRDTVGLRPFGHYAYASQWFLMAVVAGIILVVVNLRRR